ncbi:MAG: DUF6084 family protein [Deltaproteobacteria bacterium]
MPDLDFSVLDAHAEPFSLSPTLIFRLRAVNSPPDERIHTVVLRCQIQIEATRRRYAPEEQARLLDIFGASDMWARTLRSMLWTHAIATVPPFSGSAELDLPVPCTFDFNVAAAKYFYALEGGEVPLCFLFSGTAFYMAEDGSLQVAQISWSKEAKFRLPVRVWKEMMDIYYPNSAWLTVQRDAFDRLYRYKMRRGLPTWERVIETLVPEDGAGSLSSPLDTLPTSDALKKRFSGGAS